MMSRIAQAEDVEENMMREDGREEEDNHQEELEAMVKTVNNLTRMHEALAFLNDETRSREDKQISIMTQNDHGATALFWAIRRNVDFQLIQIMVDVGDKELVLLTNKYGETALHYAAFCHSPYEVFKALVDVGGKDLLLTQDRLGNTALHYACAWGIPLRTIEYMVDLGGKEVLLKENIKKLVPHNDNKEFQTKLSGIGGTDYEIKLFQHKSIKLCFFDLVMLNKFEEAKLILDNGRQQEEIFKTDQNGLNGLMATIWFFGNASHTTFENRISSLIRKMVRVGGKNLILLKNHTNSNAIHYAAFNKAPLDIIKLLVETAGKENVMHLQNNWKSTPLHDACHRQAPVEVIEYLAKQGGNNAINMRNKDHQTPLDILYDADIPSNDHIMALQRSWYKVDARFSRICSRSTIAKTLRWSNRMGSNCVISNNFVKSILNERFIWRRYQMIIFADLYMQIAIVIILSPHFVPGLYTSQNFNVDDIERGQLQFGIVILFICVTWFSCRELLQVYSSPLQTYSQSFDNFFDVLQIILVMTTIGILRKINKGGNFEEEGAVFRGTFICAMFISWIQLLFIFSQLNYSVSVFTYAVTQVRRLCFFDCDCIYYLWVHISRIIHTLTYQYSLASAIRLCR
jgi:ankyrin repeat protein